MAESKRKVIMGPSLWGYQQGDEVMVSAEQAEELVAGGHAVYSPASKAAEG